MYDDDRDALAAEYILGTLSADEREQAEALIAIDGGFAEIVRLWERRLGELNVMVEAVEPPTEVWEKIRTEIEGTGRSGMLVPAIGETAPLTAPEPTPPELQADLPADLASDLAAALAPETAPDLPSGPDAALAPLMPEPEKSSPVAALASSLLPPEPEAALPRPPASTPPSPPSPLVQPGIERSADVTYLARRVRRWRGMTAAVSAIAAVLALFVVVTQFAPGLLPLNRRAPATVTAQTQPPARFVAVLKQEPTPPAFLLTVDPQSRTLTVRTVSAATETGRSYELWLISSKQSQPRSLGIVGNEEFTRRPIPANFDLDTLRSASYAVSLEPSGGSPTGVPSGPILFTGKLVDSLPGSPPPG